MFHADLHVHSKHSRATSRDLDLEHLAWWACRKGIAVVGTGDCVHPAWLAELKDKLIPDGSGLFRLRPELMAEVHRTLPASCRGEVRFMLSTEVSTIYKKSEKTRKVHHLIYLPDFDATDRLAARLAAIGNIASDGRPILGLDSRDLLEITLGAHPDAYLVPAHVWTPWFAALGSQSGFDSIEDCYGDLAPYIFAVETGLSSDPAMNWRVSSLDRFRLTSNSDAHSPGKLGREATRFACEPGFGTIRRALETGEGYVGTVEFFPEEGKYHMDGHRACGVRLDPSETLARNGLCPVCGGRVTVGVAHRVELLADRAAPVPPPTAGEVSSLVPLPEMLAEIAATGVAAQAVTRAYDRATAALGPELAVLQEVPVEEIARADPLLGEAVGRLRRGEVIREAGYDGEYGVIRLFAEGELDRAVKGALLFEAPRRAAARPERRKPRVAAEPGGEATPTAPTPSGRGGVLAGLDPDQARAAETIDGPLLVLAGPGSGKTRMVTHRLAHLVRERGVPAASCLAVTFTRRATEELAARLAALGAGDCAVHSFHTLGLAVLRRDGRAVGLGEGFRIADEAERAGALAEALGVTATQAQTLLRDVSVLKRTGALGVGEAGEALAALEHLGRSQGWVDFDDLIGRAAQVLETDAAAAAFWRNRFRHIVADEFQDIDEMQYRLLYLLAGDQATLCVIGDPDQAIYGFRGADATCFERFLRDFPAARTVRLSRNYRSTGTIIRAGAQVMGATPDAARGGAPILLHAAEDERAEAAFVAATIEDLLGGHDMLAARDETGGTRRLSFADIAVLYRTDAQSAALRDALDRAGIPHKKSTPAPIAGAPAVRALLARLDAAHDRAPLAERIAEAARRVRASDPDLDAAALAEATRWLTALAERAENVARLGELVALSTEADFFDARADRISLLTMHAAKGLEFAVVFLVGLEDGIVPFSWGDAAETTDEERRLFYVAMTRAKERLVLTRAARRFWRGARRALPPSPFLRAIERDLVAEARAAPRQPRAFQPSLF
ncbi:UvrD-helicase domain-containing protein [Elioraea tepidiphila]|uniref:UvrD-helicase domain-containing protein n=1 Tax=Elioraea tepidiphila TaxID=457934 RepID=UPI00036405D2|nr:UvrD-helicase domain-containing protein [Elioraea tepidiphila]